MERPLFAPASNLTLLRTFTGVLIYFATGPDDGVDPQCSDKVVWDIIKGNADDHSGPYNGIFIGTQHCTPY